MPNCCVVGCNNNKQNSSASLHNFPRKDKDHKRYKAWKNRINRKDFNPNHNHVVCSVHFKEEDFENRYKKQLLSGEKVVRKLLKTAVPSLKLSGREPDNAQRRTSNYARKKIVSEAQREFLGEYSQRDVHKNLEEMMDTSANSISTICEEIGVQCELGSEVFYKDSNLYENDTDHESTITTDFMETYFSESTSDCSSNPPSEANVSSSTTSEGNDSGHENKFNFEYVLVQLSCLLSLFQFCGVCGCHIIKKEEIVRGAALYIKYTCCKGHYNEWYSCKDISKFSTYISAAVLLNGINFLPLSRFAETLKLLFISSTTYYKKVKNIISPVIENFWLNYKNHIYEEARSEEDLWISGDGQFDSPGFSAKYVTYSIMNVKTKKIIDFVLLQRGMVDGDLERVACEKALTEITSKLDVKLFLSDRHRGVGVLLRTRYPEIHHEFDVWHLSKSLLKKLSKAERKSKLLSEWNRAITNHLWWSSETCDNDSQILVDKFTSLLQHVCNIHEWDDERGEKKTCGHRNLTEEETRQIKWMKIGSSDYQVLHAEIMNKTFLNDLKHASHYCHTSNLESYHNVRLKYLPKRIHFSYNGMYIRSILAILDHNFNTNREIVGGDVQFSKSSKQWIFKNKYEKKDYSWKDDLLQQIINFNPKFNKGKKPVFKVPKNIYKIPKPSLSEAKKNTNPDS